MVELLVPDRFRKRHPAHRGGFFSAPRRARWVRDWNCTVSARTEPSFPIEISLRSAGDRRWGSRIQRNFATSLIARRRKVDSGPSRICTRCNGHRWQRGHHRSGQCTDREALWLQPNRDDWPEGGDADSRALSPSPSDPPESATSPTPRHGGWGRVSSSTVCAKDKTEFPIEISLSPLETGEGCWYRAPFGTSASEALGGRPHRGHRELESFSYSVAHGSPRAAQGMNGFAQILLDEYKDKLDARARTAFTRFAATPFVWPASSTLYSRCAHNPE